MNTHSHLAQVCRLDFWINPVFDEVVASHPHLALNVLARRGDDDRTLAALRAAHATMLRRQKMSCRRRVRQLTVD